MGLPVTAARPMHSVREARRKLRGPGQLADLTGTALLQAGWRHAPGLAGLRACVQARPLRCSMPLLAVLLTHLLFATGAAA